MRSLEAWTCLRSVFLFLRSATTTRRRQIIPIISSVIGLSKKLDGLVIPCTPLGTIEAASIKWNASETVTPKPLIKLLPNGIESPMWKT